MVFETIELKNMIDEARSLCVKELCQEMINSDVDIEAFKFMQLVNKIIEQYCKVIVKQAEMMADMNEKIDTLLSKETI